MDVGEAVAGRTDGAAGTGGYANLTQRAEAFVRERGGAAHEDVLIAHVFGGAGSATLWRPLLRQVLGAGDGVVLRPDGYWALPAVPGEPGGATIGSFVAVDVETTGLRPAQQRVVEVAAIRYRDGIEVARFETLINPQRRLPKYIVELTGIRDADLATAPDFADVADALIEFLGAETLVGHNVDFDLGFLNAELARANRPTLINDRLDTIRLATALLPSMRRPNLAALAAALDL
ncbi:MAG: 3'-5' exonuclease, partial [Chloroflexota bacterium]|nr:3'-5' exonuclease [Chloroflexota bacterium]